MSNGQEVFPYIDTDIIVRFLSGDDPKKQVQAAALFERVENGTLRVALPVLVVGEITFVLSSPRLYHMKRAEIVGLLVPILRLPNCVVQNRRRVFLALDLYLTTSLSFTDAYIAASMKIAGPATVYSYDRGYDRVQGIERIEP